MKKIFKVVMLPTEKACDIFLGKTHSKLHYKNNICDKDFKLYQHLYISSDEEINGKGYRIDLDRMSIGVIDDENYYNNPQNGNFKKVIASTDKSLSMCSKSPIDRHVDCDGCYDIPESFIQDYIKAYNEGKPITEIELEGIKSPTGGNKVGYNESEDKFILKTNRDNTVIIYRSKTHTIEDVIHAYTSGHDDAKRSINHSDGLLKYKENNNI